MCTVVQRLNTDTMQNKSKSMPSLMAMHRNVHKLICEEAQDKNTINLAAFSVDSKGWGGQGGRGSCNESMMKTVSSAQ